MELRHMVEFGGENKPGGTTFVLICDCNTIATISINCKSVTFNNSINSASI
ncbi:hypothetical protein CCACVL1_21882 [Corchorus capsularis]|uniref:Uncharacterized protein n=1 Tax=Corchorus capsularis TaxID=210143 RepID=A0A1R3H1S7_COCAP|nr:hypothetical protein CCACVL1_21882 [Corchorus capsularis]